MKKLTRLLAVLIIFALGAAGTIWVMVLRMDPQYQTETVLSTDYAVTIDTTALFFRDERVITAQTEGAFDYKIPDGEKVAKGSLIAQIYSNESEIVAQLALQEAEDALTTLKRLNEFSKKNDEGETAISRRIANEMTEWLTAVRTNSATDRNTARVGLLESISRRQILVGETLDLTEKTAQLQAERDELKAKCATPIAQVRATSAGYFSATADGYESILTTDMAQNFTVEMLEALQQPEEQTYAIGKCVQNHIWYAVCRVTADQARKLTKGDTVSLRVNSSGLRFDVQIAKINKSGIDGDAAVVLYGERNIADVINLREEYVQLEVEEYTGLKVNRDAVHIENVTVRLRDEEGNWLKDANGNIMTEQKEVPGVYIIYGEQIKFREISPLYWGSNFVICKVGAVPTGTTPVLKRYDQVIVAGKDLYDGKYIG